MGNFIRFWLDCIIIGATYGNGVFAVLEIICAIAWVWPRKKKSEEDMRPETEDKLRAWGKWCFLIVTCVSTVFVAPYVKFHTVETDNQHEQQTITVLTGSNAFLNGEIVGDKSSIETLQGQIKDNEQEQTTAELNYKTDLNEANRQKDSALERVAIFEANPERWMQVYSNMFAVIPTNFSQYFSMIAQFGIEVSNLNQIETMAEKNSKENFASDSDSISNELASLGITKLPDGHVSLNGVISGAPIVVTRADYEGVTNMIAGRTAEALTNFQTSIQALESSEFSGSQLAQGAQFITQDGKARLYAGASYCAGNLHSNALA